MSSALFEDNPSIQKSTGNGEKHVLIIPGGPGLNHNYLRPFHEELPEEKFRVHSIEFPGYVNRLDEEYPRSIKGFSKELSDIIKDFNKPLILIGHSFGASICIDYLVKNPRFRGKVVLMDVSPSGSSFKRGVENRKNKLPKDVQKKIDDLSSKKDWVNLNTLIFSEWVPRHFFKGKEAPEYLLNSLQEFSKSPLPNLFFGPNLFDIDGNYLDWDIESELQNINAEVLWMGGKEDYFDPIHVKEWAKSAGASYWIGENSSHLPFIEEREKCFSVINSFLS